MKEGEWKSVPRKKKKWLQSMTSIVTLLKLKMEP